MLGSHCEASEEVGADSVITPSGTLCMHRTPNRVEGGPVFDWLTAMLRPVSHMNRSPSLALYDELCTSIEFSGHVLLPDAGS